MMCSEKENKKEKGKKSNEAFPHYLPIHILFGGKMYFAKMKLSLTQLCPTDAFHH